LGAGGSSLFQVVSGGFSGGFRWFQVVSGGFSGFRWFQVVSDCSRLLKVKALTFPATICPDPKDSLGKGSLWENKRKNFADK
jgi:hypothetical protein